MSFVGDSTIAIVKDIKNKRLVLHVFILLALLCFIFTSVTGYIKINQSLDALHLRFLYLDSIIESKRFKPIEIPTGKNKRGDVFKIQGKYFYLLDDGDKIPDDPEELDAKYKMDLTGKYLVSFDENFQIIRMEKTLPAIIKSKKNKLKKNKNIKPNYTKTLRSYHAAPDLESLQEILDDVKEDE